MFFEEIDQPEGCGIMVFANLLRRLLAYLGGQQTAHRPFRQQHFDGACSG